MLKANLKNVQCTHDILFITVFSNHPRGYYAVFASICETCRKIVHNFGDLSAGFYLFKDIVHVFNNRETFVLADYRSDSADYRSDSNVYEMIECSNAVKDTAMWKCIVQKINY